MQDNRGLDAAEDHSLDASMGVWRVVRRSPRWRGRVPSIRGATAVNQRLHLALYTERRAKLAGRLKDVARMATGRRAELQTLTIEGPFASPRIPDCTDGERAVQQGTARVERIPLGMIDANPFRLRACDDPDEEALSASITAIGVRNPIHVRPVANGRFEVVDGERRLRALRALQQTDVVAVVAERSDGAALLDMTMLNSARVEWSDYERAKAYRQLLDRRIVQSQQKLARLTESSQPTVSNILAMLDLPMPAREFLESHPGAVSSKLARQVAALFRDFPDQETVILNGMEQLRHGLKPQALEAWVTERISPTSPDQQAATTPPPGMKRCVVPDSGGVNAAYIVDISMRRREIQVQVVDPNLSMTMVLKVIRQALRSTAAEQPSDRSSTGERANWVREPVNDGTG